MIGFYSYKVGSLFLSEGNSFFLFGFTIWVQQDMQLKENFL
jgi:hypothetical protein